MSYTTIETQYRQAFSVSQRLHTEAQAHFPNGVTHDSRHLDPFPLYVQRSAGPRKWDVQGHELIDYWAGTEPCCWVTVTQKSPLQSSSRWRQ